VNLTIPTRRAWLSLCSLLVLYPIVAGCKPTTPPPMPLSQLNAQQMRGHAIFQASCSQCHDDRDSDALHGPSMLGVFKQQYLPSGAPANDDRVRVVILEGHGMMPAINLDSQNTQDLIAYLHTL
jgi:mono/diheme cytochrome c family protein